MEVQGWITPLPRWCAHLWEHGGFHMAGTALSCHPRSWLRQYEAGEVCAHPVIDGGQWDGKEAIQSADLLGKM